MKPDPAEIGRYLQKNFTSNVVCIGLDSGGTSGHLATHLRRQSFQVAVLDALQVHRVLSIKRNKTDTNDARGIAEITRTGREYLTEVYVKSAACFEIRAQLIMRQRLVQQRLTNEAMIRGLLRLIWLSNSLPLPPCRLVQNRCEAQGFLSCEIARR